MSKTIIKAGENTYFPNFSEIFKYKHLLLALAWRDIRVKYAQTYVGLLWAFINPIFNLIVLSFVFGTVAQVDTDGLSQVIFTIAGLCGWTYFSTLFSESGNSIVGAQNMIKKIYFPRMVIPLSKAISGLVDFGIVLICLIVLMIYHGVWPGPNLIYLPIFIVIALISGLVGGIFISALSARFRDFTFIVPMIIRLGLFATPVAYSTSLIPEEYKALYFLNPMAGVVEGFRWSLLGVGSPEPYMFYSIGILFILLIIGLVLFARVERVMADIL